MENSDKERKQIFKGRRQTVCAVVLALAILAVGIVLGAAASNFYRNYKEEKQQEEIEEASGAKKAYADCIKLGKYKNLSVSLEVTEEDLQQGIKSLLDEYTTYKHVKKGKAMEGDAIYGSYEVYVDGQKVNHFSGEEYFELGVGAWPAGVEQAFVGLSPGKTKTVKVSVPEGFFGDQAVDGKNVRFKLKLIYICGAAIVPDYDNQFVQAISDCKTVEEYNARLKKELGQENEESKEEYAWSDVLEDSTVTKYPEDLMEEARRQNLQDYYNMAKLYGQSLDEVFQTVGCANEEEFKATMLEDLAQDTVKEILLANAIAYAERIKYTKSEYEKLVKEEYEYYKESYAGREEFERENEFDLKNKALIQAAKRWVSEHAEYTE